MSLLRRNYLDTFGSHRLAPLWTDPFGAHRTISSHGSRISALLLFEQAIANSKQSEQASQCAGNNGNRCVSCTVGSEHLDRGIGDKFFGKAFAAATQRSGDEGAEERGHVLEANVHRSTRARVLGAWGTGKGRFNPIGWLRCETGWYDWNEFEEHQQPFRYI